MREARLPKVYPVPGLEGNPIIRGAGQGQHGQGTYHPLNKQVRNIHIKKLLSVDFTDNSAPFISLYCLRIPEGPARGER